MARFATDPKISTQLGRREAPCLGKCYKAFFFGHYINFIPWHKSHFNVTDVLVLSVTYVFVSYRRRCLGNCFSIKPRSAPLILLTGILGVSARSAMSVQMGRRCATSELVWLMMNSWKDSF